MALQKQRPVFLNGQGSPQRSLREKKVLGGPGKTEAASKGKGFLLEPRIVVCFSPPNEKTYMCVCPPVTQLSRALKPVWRSFSQEFFKLLCSLQSLKDLRMFHDYFSFLMSDQDASFVPSLSLACLFGYYHFYSYCHFWRRKSLQGKSRNIIKLS